MIIPLLLAVSLVPTQPTLPPGLNKPFMDACYEAEEDLAKGDFEAAKQAILLLPKPEAKVYYDDSQAPPSMREAYRATLGFTLQEARPLGHFTTTDAKDADISVTFVKSLPPVDGDLVPTAARVLFHRSMPRVTLEITTHRMEPPTLASSEDFHNEVAFALVQYCGLERAPKFGSYTGRTDQSVSEGVRLNSFELQLAKLASDAVASLEKLVEEKAHIEVAAPKVQFDTTSIDNVRGIEAHPLDVSVKVTNHGNADLILYALPDCGCLNPRPMPPIKPNESADLISDINTSTYSGHLNHRLLVYTNDPSLPVQEILVNMYVEPQFRFVHTGPDVVPIGPTGADFDAFVLFAEPVNLSIITAAVHGLHGTVQTKPWKGTLPDDPDSDGKTTVGYRFHIHLDPQMPYGKFQGSLLIGTDNDTYREMTYDFDVQKGIVADPGQVYFGSVLREPEPFSFLLNTAGTPFKVTRIESDSPYFSAKAISLHEGREYRVDVQFDGKAEPGSISTSLNIYTNDPKQPVIRVALKGQVQ
jgi:hypothetical protein